MSAPPAPVRLSRGARIAFACVLGATLAAEPFVERHAEFGMDGIFGFNAWYGFAACALMVLFAKLLLGPVIARPDDYYDD